MICENPLFTGLLQDTCVVDVYKGEERSVLIAMNFVLSRSHCMNLTDIVDLRIVFSLCLMFVAVK